MSWNRYLNKEFKKLFLLLLFISLIIFGYKYQVDYEKNIKIVQSQQRIELSVIQEIVEEHLKSVIADLGILVRDADLGFYEKKEFNVELEEHMRIILTEKD